MARESPLQRGERLAGAAAQELPGVGGQEGVPAEVVRA